mgnify:CR=1 FL=1
MTKISEFNDQDPSEQLKASFRRHASGVCVITSTLSDGAPVGFTATSVTSLGANPPLLTFNVARGSSSWPALVVGAPVAVHTLGAANLQLAKKMSSDHTLRFIESDWIPGPNNAPVFVDATSVLIGTILEIHNVENNAVVVVRVSGGALGGEDSALLYNQRGYFAPGQQVS